MAIPPLSGFRAFDAAARHLSFTLAAKELFVTQAAVSQRIKQLEEQLGFRLFVRRARALDLTEEGRQLAPVVARSVNAIAEAIDAIKADERSGPLTVSTLPSFAMKWLIPRLSDFNRYHPEIELRIHADDTPVDFSVGGIDVAVRYVFADTPGLHAVPLMREEVFPVCSPALLKRSHKLEEPDDLRHFVLIHDETDSRFGEPNCHGLDWETWCRAVGVEIDTRSGLFFNQGDMVIAAAVEGQGVAITRTSLAQDDIDAGRLVRLFESNVMASGGYWIVCREEMAQRTKIVAFREWLLRQAADSVTGTAKHL
ncbi:MAG: transcriptional regulator GcvA [Pseudomonadota bacterium]